MKNIKNIFDMAKADRYTADGREEIIKAQEAEIEDVKYNPGDISKATGLQKQPDGSWAPPKKGAGIPKFDEKTFVGKTYKDFIESARASGYSPKLDKENPDGSSSTTFEDKEGKSIRVDFDKYGKIQEVKFGTSSKSGEGSSANKEAAKSDKKDPMEEMRNTDRPLSTMENQIKAGSYDDAIIESEGDSTAIMDIARDILSPAFDRVPNREIPESWLKAARNSVRKRYTALRNDAMGDAAPLTGDTKIRVKK